MKIRPLQQNEIKTTSYGESLDVISHLQGETYRLVLLPVRDSFRREGTVLLWRSEDSEVTDLVKSRITKVMPNSTLGATHPMFNTSSVTVPSMTVDQVKHRLINVQ